MPDGWCAFHGPYTLPVLRSCARCGVKQEDAFPTNIGVDLCVACMGLDPHYERIQQARQSARSERCPTCESLVGQRVPLPLAQCPDAWHGAPLSASRGSE